MVRQDKADKVKELEKLFSSANALVLAEYRGLTVTEQTKLRRELKNAGATFNVVKMSLAKRAAENIGYLVLHPRDARGLLHACCRRHHG